MDLLLSTQQKEKGKAKEKRVQKQKLLKCCQQAQNVTVFSHSRIQNSKIFFQNTFRQLENLKYWRNFEGVHEKREFRFFTEKMSSILNLSLVFSDQLVPE